MSLTDEHIQTAIAERADATEIRFDLERVKADAARPESDTQADSSKRPQLVLWAAAALAIVGGAAMWAATRPVNDQINATASTETDCGLGTDLFCADQFTVACNHDVATGDMSLCIGRVGSTEVEELVRFDGTWWLNMGPQRRFVLAGSDGGSLIAPDGQVTNLDLHPSKRVWWFGSEGLLKINFDDRIEVFDIDGTLIETIRYPELPDASFQLHLTPTLSPDEQRLAVVSRKNEEGPKPDSTVWVLDRPTRSWSSFVVEGQIIPPGDGLAWSADSRDLYVMRYASDTAGAPELSRLAVDTSEWTSIASWPDHMWGQFVASPDASLLAVKVQVGQGSPADATNRLVVVDPETGEQQGTYEIAGSNSIYAGLSWSAGGDWLAVGGPTNVLLPITEDGELGPAVEIAPADPVVMADRINFPAIR